MAKPERDTTKQSGIQSVGYIRLNDITYPVYSVDEIKKYLRISNHGLPGKSVEELFKNHWENNPDILLIHSFHPPKTADTANEYEDHITLLENLLNSHGH